MGDPGKPPWPPVPFPEGHEHFGQWSCHYCGDGPFKSQDAVYTHCWAFPNARGHPPQEAADVVVERVIVMAEGNPHWSRVRVGGIAEGPPFMD